MEIIDFSKPTMMYDVLLIVENKKIYCNRAILSIWSNVFEIMFKSNFKEKESSEVYLMGKKKINIRLKESFIKFFLKIRPMMIFMSFYELFIHQINKSHL